MTFSWKRTEIHIRPCPKFVIITTCTVSLNQLSVVRTRKFFALICSNFHMGRGASCALRSGSGNFEHYGRTFMADLAENAMAAAGFTDA